MNALGFLQKVFTGVEHLKALYDGLQEVDNLKSKLTSLEDFSGEDKELITKPPEKDPEPGKPNIISALINLISIKITQKPPDKGEAIRFAKIFINTFFTVSEQLTQEQPAEPGTEEAPSRAKSMMPLAETKKQEYAELLVEIIKEIGVGVGVGDEENQNLKKSIENLMYYIKLKESQLKTKDDYIFELDEQKNIYKIKNNKIQTLIFEGSDSLNYKRADITTYFIKLEEAEKQKQIQSTFNTELGKLLPDKFNSAKL